MLGGYLPSVLNVKLFGLKMLGGYLPSVLNVDFFRPKTLGEYQPSVLNVDFFGPKNAWWIPTQCFKRRLFRAKIRLVDTYPVFQT